MSILSKLFGKPDSPPSDPIDSFWYWWEGAGPKLAAAFDSGKGPDSSLVEEISNHVHAMDRGLAWETGPGKKSKHHFALSGAGDAELRVLTQRWLSRAPAPSKTWEYYPARQAGGADPKQTLELEGRTFAYGDFRLVLERDEARSIVHVGLFHPNFAGMESDARFQPGFLFLDDLLGEDAVTSWVGGVETLDVEPQGATTGGSLIEEIHQMKESWDSEKVSLLEGMRGDQPMIAVVRLGLKRLDHLLHDHYLELTFHLREANENGFHSEAEGDELNALEDELMQSLGPRAIWIGHETGAKKRVAHFHVNSDPAISEQVEKICRAHGTWEHELSVHYDPSWEILKRF